MSAGNPPPYLGWNVAYEAEGNTPPSASERPRTMDAVVMPGYFRTLRIPLVEGRDFTPATRAPAARRSSSSARRSRAPPGPAGRAVGRRVRLIRREGGDAPWREVVGVVGDTRTSTFAPPRGWVYLPHGQPALQRTRADDPVQGRCGRRHPRRPAAGMEGGARRCRSTGTGCSTISSRNGTGSPASIPRLFAVFSAVAFAVALVGVYGVVAYASLRRTREFGIRLAIGSPPAEGVAARGATGPAPRRRGDGHRHSGRRSA